MRTKEEYVCSMKERNLSDWYIKKFCEYYDKPIPIYVIRADYRDADWSKEHPNYYYVYGKSKTQARIRFSSLISWLAVYEVRKLSFEEAVEVVSNPEHYALI